MYNNEMFSKLSTNLDCEKFSFDGMEFKCLVKRVVDGDTVYIIMETKYGVKLFNCRILDLDTPELRKDPEIASMAKRETELFTRDKICIARCGKFDNFGRLLISLEVDGKDLASHLIEERLGVRYDGKKKSSFEDLYKYHSIQKRN
jgi:endonuclease YncB( thermonuclease family)